MVLGPGLYDRGIVLPFVVEALFIVAMWCASDCGRGELIGLADVAARVYSSSGHKVSTRVSPSCVNARSFTPTAPPTGSAGDTPLRRLARCYDDEMGIVTRRARTRLGRVVVLGSIMTACSNLPAQEPPPPIVAPAPPAVARLVVHVFRLVTPPVTPEDDRDYHHMPGYTGELRRIFQLELVRAGFTVTLDRAEPADLVAVIQSDMPTGQPGVATLALSRGGSMVDRISVPVPVSGKPPKTVHHAAETAVRLVEAMSQSPAVARLAEEVRSRGQQHRVAKQPARPPGQCEPDRELDPEPSPPEVECVIEAVAHCQPPSPVRRAWQSIPFVQCPPEIGPIVEDVLRLPAEFSPQQTRERRLQGECGATPQTGECCYVQFAAQRCR